MNQFFTKRRHRDTAPSFANINLLGRCNAQCYFCLGRDLGPLIDGRHDERVHFSKWPKFGEFLDTMRAQSVSRVYITGQNTDALLCECLDELVDELHRQDFQVGLRTNGLLAHKHFDAINRCDLSTGYSIHSLKPETLQQIMGWSVVPDWDNIIAQTERPRIAMVVGRHNVGEFADVLALVGRHPNVRYFQVRRVSTDTRQSELSPDAAAYEKLFSFIAETNPIKRIFHGAQVYDIDGIEVVFWRTVQTTVSSINYFTDGTISNNYFIVEGYLKNRVRT
jgi:molybdenum cofactor biosynthesis enzyme MoaA